MHALLVATQISLNGSALLFLETYFWSGFVTGRMKLKYIGTVGFIVTVFFFFSLCRF